MSGPVPGGSARSSIPCSSRVTATIGCTTRWMPTPRRLSSALTESTRKGMSSVTTVTTVRPHRPAVGGDVGLATRTTADPGLRCCGDRELVPDGTHDRLRRAAGHVAGVHVPVEHRRESLVAHRRPVVPLGEANTHVRLLPLDARMGPLGPALIGVHTLARAHSRSRPDGRSRPTGVRGPPGLYPCVPAASQSCPIPGRRPTRSSHGQEVLRRHPLRRRTGRRVRRPERSALRRVEARAHGCLRRVRRRRGGRRPTSSSARRGSCRPRSPPRRSGSSGSRSPSTRCTRGRTPRPTAPGTGTVRATLRGCAPGGQGHPGAASPTAPVPS